MTVANTNATAISDGNGVTTSFPVPFRILDEAHLDVVVLRADGTEDTLVLNSDYTVSGVGNETASISTSVAPAVGEKIARTRNVPLDQLADYVGAGKFPADSHENALDKLTMIAQQQQSELGRTLRVSLFGDASDPVDPDDIETVADQATNISTVADSIAAVDNVNANMADINSVAGNLTPIGSVSANMAAVVAVNDNEADIQALAANTPALLAAAQTTTDKAAEASGYLDQFESVWLGLQATDPNVDLNGDPLTGGELYLNSVSGLARTYNTVGGWRDVGSSAEVQSDTFTTNGTAGPYTLPTAPLSKANVFVNMNGVGIKRSDFEIVGNQLTFNYVPGTGLETDVAVLGTAEIGVPSAGTVGFDQLTTEASALVLMRKALEKSSRRFRWNYILNGDMSRNTRGQAGYSSAGYTLDSWKHSPGTGATVSVSQFERPASASTKFTQSWARPVAGTSPSYLSQRIRDVRTLAGETITVEALVSATADTEITAQMVQLFGTGGNSPSPTNYVGSEEIISITGGVDQLVQFTVDMDTLDGKTIGDSPTENNNIELLFKRNHDSTNPTATVYVTEVAIVEGDATGDDKVFYDRGSLEDDLCAEFVASSYDAGVTPGTPGAYNGREIYEPRASGGVSWTSVNLPKAMPGPPDITLYSPASGAAGKVTAEVAGDINGQLSAVGTRTFSVSNSEAAGANSAWLQFHYLAVYEL